MGVAVADILQAAGDLLGDGAGKEWHENPEYTRGIVELVTATVGLQADVDPSGSDRTPFVLGMIHGARCLRAEREAQA